MKRNLYLFLTILFVGTVQTSAQQIAVCSRDGHESRHEEVAYEKARITFSDGQMLVHFDGTVRGTYNIKDIERIVFYKRDASSVNALDATPGVVYDAGRQELVVQAGPGTTINVYRVCGTCVLSRLQTMTSPAISVAHLPAGIYVAVVGSETIKFVKQ